MLPQDPVILLSVVNARLRDLYAPARAWGPSRTPRCRCWNRC